MSKLFVDFDVFKCVFLIIICVIVGDKDVDVCFGGDVVGLNGGWIVFFNLGIEFLFCVVVVVCGCVDVLVLCLVYYNESEYVKFLLLGVMVCVIFYVVEQVCVEVIGVCELVGVVENLDVFLVQCCK